MYNYEIILYWSAEDNAFIAEVPELPGCIADGATRIEALNNAETIIAEWIETAEALGRSIPVPKGKLSAETYDNLVENAYIIGNKSNYDWLMESKKQLENGETFTKELPEDNI